MNERDSFVSELIMQFAPLLVLSRNLARGSRFVLVACFRNAAQYPSHETHRDSSSVRANVGRGGTG